MLHKRTRTYGVLCIVKVKRKAEGGLFFDNLQLRPETEETKVARIRSFSSVLITVVAVLLFGSSTLIGQIDTASLLGRAVDSSGAVIPSASVAARNLATNFVYHTQSDSSGQWTISPVRIGTYQVTVSAKGFSGAVVGPITLNVQQSQRVDVILHPGEVSQRVMVSGSSPLIQTDTSEIGQVINHRMMVGLPLNGRNPVQLAQLTVGVVPTAPGSRTTAAFGFSANGNRSIDNNFQLDGVDNNSNLSDLLNEANYVYMPAPDALQEFKIDTGNYDAQFGRSMGAIVNAVTRSGSNQFHGVLYEFFRNQNLDAMNYFDTRLQPFHQNQFGATIGGPIISNKLFFFGDYEGLRISQAQPDTSVVPTSAQRSGDFTSQMDLGAPTGVLDCNGSQTYQGEIFDTTLTQTSASSPSGFCGVPFGYENGFPSNVIPVSKIDPAGAKLVQLYPLPNATAPGYNYLSDPSQTNTMNHGDLRIDQVLSSRDSSFYRFSISRNPDVIPSPLPGLADGGGFFTGDQHISTYSLAISETHIFSHSKVNEFRFGFNQQSATRYQFNSNEDVSQQIGLPGVPFSSGNGGIPQFTFNDASTLGSPTYLPSIESQATYETKDTFTLVTNSQTIKFGGDIRPEEFQFNQPPAPRGSMGFGPQFTDNAGDPGSGGSGLAALLTGQPSSGLINSIHNGSFVRHTWALFLQDDWRVTPTVTLNLGMRYEYFAPPLEHSNDQANFNGVTGELDIPKDNKIKQLTPILASIIPVNDNAPDGLLVPDRNNFGPRVGLAAQLSPEFALQSAFGVFYNPNEGGIWGYAATNPPFLSSESFNTTCSLPSYNPPAQDCSIPGLRVLSNGFPADSLSNPNTPNLLSYKPDLRIPYVIQWHLTLQDALGKSSMVEVSYVGNKGNKEFIQPNLNQAAPSADPSAPTAPRRPFPNIDAYIGLITSEGSSNYNAFQTSFNQRLSHGLTAILNYTYSKALGDASTTMGAQSNEGFRYIRDLQAEYGPLSNDIRNRFTGSFIYQLPFGQGRRLGGSVSPSFDRFIGHWAVTGIVILSSGNYFTVTDGNGNFANSDGQQRPNVVPGKKATDKPCVTGTFFNTCAFEDPQLGSFGNASLNSLEGPGFQDVDFAIQKIVPIHEGMHLELRGEAFNALNHPNKVFAAPGPQNGNNSTVFGAPSFGFLTAAQSPREIQIAAKFVY